jgi:hypothetical protein
MFVLTLQGQQSAARMRVWRALKALGAVVLRDGVYLLPNQAEFTEALQAQCEEVIASGGSGQVLEVEARNQRQEVQFRRLFDRTAEYDELMGRIRALSGSLRRIDAAGLSASLSRLRRDFDVIAAQDYFAGAARDQAREALEQLLVAADTVLSPDEPRATAGRIQRLEPARHQGRIWATRARPWADRLASAWLIKRFIDPAAKWLWLDNPKDCPKRAVGFDFDGAQFTHVGARVTFEVLLASFGLTGDPALERVAALVHYLDVGGVPVAEAAGLAAMLRGAQQRISDDNRLVDEAAKLFEYLYLHYGNSA